MKNESSQLPKWIIRLGIIIVLIGILAVISTAAYKSLPSWETGWFAKAGYKVCKLATGDNQVEILLEPNWYSCQTRITLEPNQLSQWIVTPVGSVVRVSREFDSRIRFPGTDWVERPNNSFKDHGIRRGIFQLLNLGQIKGDIIITVER